MFWGFVVFFFTDLIFINTSVEDGRSLPVNIVLDLVCEGYHACFKQCSVAATADEDGTIHVVVDEVSVPLLGSVRL